MRKISPSLYKKLKNKEQTLFNNSEPKMDVAIARARSSIMDSSYFTIETIRTKDKLGDISIGLQRLKPYGPSNRIYEIHIDEGIAKTAIREYPDRLKEGWKEQFDIGPAISVAIAFDGRWKLNDKKQWQLVTFDEPHIFWVDKENKLISRIWDKEDTLKELAQNVSKVKAIRAWKNASIGSHDQGIVVAYIKADGKVYYRNFCEQEDGTFIWEAERQVSEFMSVAVNLNLFITNDYRTGIIIENNQGQITWLITGRNWASMAIAPEKISVRSNTSINLIEVNKIKAYEREKITATMSGIKIDYLYASPYNEFILIENIDDEEGNFGRLIKIKTKYKLNNVNIDDFILIDSNERTFVGIDIRKTEDDVYVGEFMNFNNARGEVQLVFKGIYAKNDVGFKYDEFRGNFTPINLVPVETPAPEVVSIYNVEVVDW